MRAEPRLTSTNESGEHCLAGVEASRHVGPLSPSLTVERSEGGGQGQGGAGAGLALDEGGGGAQQEEEEEEDCLSDCLVQSHLSLLFSLSECSMFPLSLCQSKLHYQLVKAGEPVQSGGMFPVRLTMDQSAVSDREVSV